MSTENHNLSTDHQPKGGARRPSDTLDRPQDDVTQAEDWQPGADEGKVEPGVAPPPD